MPCAHPIPAVRPRLGGRVLLGHAEIRDFTWRAESILNRPGQLLLPCGTCVGCQISRARSWAVRCSLELVDWPVASFLTLTYSDRYVPPTLSKEHYAGFIKALRKRYPPKGLRHFGCGEYGDETHRPHYHAILFGVSPDDHELIERSWGRGFATLEAVTPGRVAYTAGYCAKKVGQFDRGGERVDCSTGEVYEYQRPFQQMSRRPGIGGAARRHWKSWRTTAIYRGREVPAPRFLHQSWKDNAGELAVAELELEKLQSRMYLTVRELDAAEAIATARVELKSLGRSL